MSGNMSAVPNGTPVPRRRNGKSPSCEPCRKAKIACDHTSPVCERCKRRKISAKCVYLEAPMTRVPAERRKELEGRLQSSSPPSYTSPAKRTSTSNTTPSSAFPSTPEYTANSTSRTTTGSGGPFISSGGFFGPTNFSAVFLENRENLGNDIQISNDSETHGPALESLQSQTFLMLAGNEFQGSPRVALGVKVLRGLPDKATFNFLMEWYLKKCYECSFHKPSVIKIANSFWKTWGKQLKEPRRLDDLEAISSLVCKNNETALPEFNDYEPWLESLSDTRMRWETLGSIFGALCSALLSLPDRDAFFCTQRSSRRKRSQFAAEMKDCVQACITLSNYRDLINVQMVALLSKNLILQTVISGDTSLLVWRQLGDLVSASTALGLHRDWDNTRPISFGSEMKRRIFAVVFNIDKGSSLLCGRPPALSYRYTKFQLPLDLSDEILMQGNEAIAKAVKTLDANGFNTEGEIGQATTTRTAGLLSVLLNEILELSLGEVDETTDDRIRFFADKLDRIYTSFPAILQWNQESVSANNISDSIFWTRLCQRLPVLEYKILLERLAHKRGISNGQSMVDCAREMLELTVLIWVQRDRFVEHHHDYDWMVVCYGVPSSGVLCVELLKQIKLGSDTPHVPILPRSEIVQNLSLLIGFLEWVRPAAGNYQLCMRMRQIIKRILDQILNPTFPPSQQEPIKEQLQQQQFDMTNPTATSVVDAFDASVFEPGNYDDGLDNLEWLNSVDWSRGPWIDLGGQDYSAARYT